MKNRRESFYIGRNTARAARLSGPPTYYYYYRVVHIHIRASVVRA